MVMVVTSGVSCSQDEATVEPELLCDEHEEQSEPSGQVRRVGR